MTRRLTLVNINRRAETREGCDAISSAFERLEPALSVEIVHWPEVLQRPLGGCVVLGPNEDPFPAYPEAFAELLDWVRAQPGPLLGICGGHQALALAYGGEVGPVYDVAPATTSYAGMPKVDAAVTLALTREDPILADLERTVALHARHVDHVRGLPDTFVTLARSPGVPHQIVRRRDQPIYGIQAHPERPTPRAAGDILLRNFLDLRAT